MTNETTNETAPKNDEAKSAATETKPPVRKRPAKKSSKTAKKAAKKTTATKAATKAGARGSAIATLDDLFDAFLGHLPKIGKSEGTVRSYSADLAVARKHFGGDAPVKALTPRKVTTYFTSDAVTRTRSGGEKNAITVAKLCRVFRQAVEFGVASGTLDTSPMPEKK